MKTAAPRRQTPFSALAFLLVKLKPAASDADPCLPLFCSRVERRTVDRSEGPRQRAVAGSRQTMAIGMEAQQMSTSGPAQRDQI